MSCGPPAGPGPGVRPVPLRLPGQHVRRDGHRHSEGIPIRSGPRRAARPRSCRCSCCTTTRSCRGRHQGRGSLDAKDNGVVATDEYLLSSGPYATKRTPGATTGWCYTRKRLEDLDWMMPTVLVNHFPMVREPCDVMFYPEFSLWCGTTATRDWHTRFTTRCVRSTAPAFRAPRGTTGCASKRSRWAIRGSGADASLLSLAPAGAAGPELRPLSQRLRRPFRHHPEMQAQSAQFRTGGRGGHDAADRPVAARRCGPPRRSTPTYPVWRRCPKRSR